MINNAKVNHLVISMDIILFRKSRLSFMSLMTIVILLILSFSTDSFSDQVHREQHFIIEKRYLIFPVRENNRKVRVNVKIEGEYFQDFDISLSDSIAPDIYVFIDLEKHKRKNLHVEVSKLLNGQEIGFDMVGIVDEIPGFDNLYSESLRPQFHFTSKRGVIGDPNGLVYHEGLYHLYHQHNPFGRYFFNMSWGHAVSKDLIHWKQMDEAIRPASYKDDAWSGGAVVDKNNTSGFQIGNTPPIVIAYTSSRRGECIAYSNDGGITFTPYQGNPVLKGATANRDPKIFWYEPGNHWVMARNYAYEKKEYMGFYSSSDLKNWKLEGKEGFFHSCPEAYELPVIGSEGVKKWVIHDMFGLYKIGDFNGKEYKSDVAERITYNHGSSYVSGQVFTNHPEDKKVMMAFSYNGVNPDMPFNNCMLFPVELRLKNTTQGIRLCPKPIEAIVQLHDEEFIEKNIKLSKLKKKLITLGDFGDLLHIKLNIEDLEGKFTFEVNGASLTLENDSLYIKGNLKTPVNPIMRTAIDKGGMVKGPLPIGEHTELEIILDKTTMEIFGNDGELYMPIGLYFYPDFMKGLFGGTIKQTKIIPFKDPLKREMKISYNQEDLRIKSFEVYKMKSIWK